MREEDRLLGPDGKISKPVMRCKRDRITQLSAAKTEDLKTNSWSFETGGPKFNALIEKFKAEDAGKAPDDEKKRLSRKELMDKAGNFRCEAVQKAFLISAGEIDGKTSGLNELDDRCYRDEQALKVLGDAWDRLPKPMQELVTHILHDAPPVLRTWLDANVLIKG
jgi:hypothetical protein